MAKKQPKQGLSKEEVLSSYIEAVEALKRSPKMSELKDYGVTNNMVKHHFGSLTLIDDAARKESEKSFNDVKIEDIIDKSSIKKLRDTVKKHKRFVVTSAVTGCEVDEDFYGSIKNYCKLQNAALLILVSSDASNASGKISKYGTIDKRLAQECIVIEDTDLNSNIFLSTIKLSAKNVDPISGLDRIGQRDGTFVFASPKQRMHMVATSNIKLPHALMTTGAITKPNYVHAGGYMNERVSYVADHDHVMGAIIVEIVDNDEYHYRQVQASKHDGSFIDLGVRYTKKTAGKESPEAIIPGDWHSGETDPHVAEAIAEMCALMKPNKMILHDAFNGMCVNHHEDHYKLLRAKRAMANELSLSQELAGLAKDLNYLSTLVKQVVVVKSNHDEFLSGHYLQKGKYVDDPHNHYLALKLAQAMMEGHDPIRVGTEMHGLNPGAKVRWMARDEDYKIAGIQVGAHGDQGANGKKNPGLAGMEKSYGNCVFGHSHTPGILRGAWSVGTSSYLKLCYNSGPSSWMQTVCLVYANGSRQLINVIEGKWKL